MGCYRYQDVENVPLEGLFCLLWDVEENQRGQVISALRDRSLVDYSDGKYHLHPLIRNEAINRLRNSKDWEKSNIEAAKFSTESVKTIDTNKDAQQALEAYYHYFNIRDYEKASEVILLPRNNKFQASENLGYAFCRLGLLTQMTTCINSLIPYLDKDCLLIDKSLNLVTLYNVLGALYIYRGEITLSIKYNQISGEICERCIQMAQGSEQKLFWKKQLNKVYYFIGLCKIDLFELQEAKKFFEKALNSYTLEFHYKNGFNEREIKVAKIDILVYMAFLYSCLLQEFNEREIKVAKRNILVYMAFLYSSLLQEEAVRKLANELLTDIFDRNLFFASGSKGYNPLFLGITFKNLGEFKKSFDMCNHVIRYAQESNFNQIEATALIYLGELYRIQKNYDIALAHHSESIKTLEKIGAKCDLAEAYFQLALTYQAMGYQPNSQTYFDKALKLWGPENIDAPKQIERVKTAMQTNP
jgi:tetratricopeptide (TPR) repeat protein